jgi:NTP pyrophosphatase (non-canonical NTP hydrolase)
MSKKVYQPVEKKTFSALQALIAERQRQDAKWGEQNHEPQFWMGILMEEVGELAQAVNETVFDNGEKERAKGGYVNMRAEAVQVAAVAVAFVEMLDRRYWGVDYAKEQI